MTRVSFLGWRGKMDLVDLMPIRLIAKTPIGETPIGATGTVALPGKQKLSVNRIGMVDFMDKKEAV